MIIGVEADVLTRSDSKTGIPYFVEQLFRALLAIDHKNSYYFVYLSLAGQAANKLSWPEDSYRWRRLWFPRKLYNLLLRSPLRLPIDALAALRADLFIFPNFVRWPLLITKRSVVFVHDLVFLEQPEVMKTGHHRRYLQRAVPRSVRLATHVVTISESTKEAVIRHYGVPTDKVSVVTPAVDHEVYKPAGAEQVAAVRQKYSVGGAYILYLGTLEPRKNISGIIKSYLELPTAEQGRYKLVLAGGAGWGQDELEGLWSGAPAGRIVQTGYVQEADKPALYSGATVFMYPSHYEGWGMPVLEAMACGAPVITANNTSLPEVAGEAAMMVDSRDQAGLNQALRHVLESDERRQQMRQAGLKQAARFSWETSARQFLDVINGLAD